ncbi:MAG: transglutaminase family protein [Butyrivibrio sp.]|nr:transglutaminase family protein [Butyrivibrio sp.]
MLRLNFSYETTISFSKDIDNHVFLLRCFPLNIPEQLIEDMQHTTYPLALGGQYSIDSFGNTIYTGRIDSRHDSFSYTISGSVLRDDTAKVSEILMPCYKYPSELTYGSYKMGLCLEKIKPHGTNLEKAHQIADFINKYMTYESGSTSVYTTAKDAFDNKKGVCQDFAHVMIAMCKMIGIPSRYVCGLPVGDGQTHAWVEIWQDGYWHGIDPTRGCDADERYIKLCVGRDYNDCPVERGIFNGDAIQTQDIYMKVSPEKEVMLA